MTRCPFCLEFSVLLLGMACSPESPRSSPVPGDSIAAGDSDPIVDSRYRTVLNTPTDFAALQAEMDGEVKYLLLVDGQSGLSPLTGPSYFQDMHQFDWHIEFINSFDELSDVTFDDYLQYVLQAPTRIWWGGAIKIWPAVNHPMTNAPGVVSYTVYNDATLPDSLTAAHIVRLDQQVKTAAPFAQDLLVFVPSDLAQKSLVLESAADLQAANVATLMPEQLLDGIPSESYSLGQGFGTLHLVPEGELLDDYGPRDVVVVQSAPNDISIVAGLVTAEPQNLHSHVNLRLQEKGIPNAAVPLIYENEYVASLDTFLVQVMVTESTVTLAPARLEDAEAFWQAQRPELPPLSADLSPRDLTGFGDLHANDASAYGAKAANLGELHDILPAGNRTEGFGLPFAHYADFVTDNGLDALISGALADERMKTNAAFKSSTLKTIRQQFRATPLDPAFFALLESRMRGVFGDTVTVNRIRFRSSTNVEDLEELTGAGLYDSRSGCLADDLDSDALGPSLCLSETERITQEQELAARQQELVDYPERYWLMDIIDELQDDLTNEKPVADAVRDVWSSLWNERAFDERAYYGLEHQQAYMGMAVNPAFVMELANGVAMTNLPVTEGLPLYRLVSQVGEMSVVRPEDPTVIAEVLTLRRDGDLPSDIELLVPSSLAEPGTRVFSDPELNTLAPLLFLVQDHFAANVYPHIDPLHLDTEVKLTRDGEVVIKQARPYLVTGP